MAETGPCGPCSEIHIDRGEHSAQEKCSRPRCAVTGLQALSGDMNLVFMQYNRSGATQFDALPATHVDTGMGFERIVSIMQKVDSNYRTDLFTP